MRISTASLMLILLTLPSSLRSLDAQEPRLKLRRIYVPADAPESWPAGDWTLIPASRLKQAARRRNDETVSGAWIKHAHFAATFRDGTLQDGEFELDIETPSHPRENHTTLLSWDESNVAFSNLEWEEAPAKLGTSLQNKTLLLVPRDQRHLSGEWSFRGRRLAHGYQFTVRFPPAAVTELTLALPRQAGFKTFDQTPWSWLDSSGSESRFVRLNLGSRTTVNFAVSLPNQSLPVLTDSSVFTRGETLVVLSRDQSRFRQELVIEALEAPLSALVFKLPTGIDVSEVKLGELLLEDWSITGQRQQFLRVNFPEPFTGRSRPLRLTGLLNHPLNTTWRLKPIVPLDSQAISNRVTINVTPPFELLTVEEDGYRQTAATTMQTGSGSLTFEAIAPDGSINIRIGLPDNRLRTEIVTRITNRKNGRTAFCELTGNVSSGRLYTFSMLLANGWTPSSIELNLDADDEWLNSVHWWISEEENLRYLNVELPRAISRDQSLKLRMNFRQFQPTAQPPVIPVVRTQNEFPCDQLIVLERDPLSFRSRSSPPPGWIETNLENSPAWLQKTDIGQELGLDSTDAILLSARSPAFTSLPDPARRSHLVTRSENRVVLSQAETGKVEIEETMTFHLDATTPPLSDLEFTTTSDATLRHWTWSVDGHPEVEIQCHQENDHTVAQQNLWRLTFMPPLTGSVHVTARQKATSHDEWMAVLPTIHHSPQHDGQLVLDNRLPGSVSIISPGLLDSPLARELPGGEQFESEYFHAGESLRIVFNEDPADIRTRTDLHWHTLLASPHSDQVLHTLKMELPAGTTRLSGTWPDAVSAPTAWVDDKPVRMDLDPAGQFELNWARSIDTTRVEIEFLSSILWDHSEYLLSVPLPQFDLQPRHCEWTLQLPDDCRISDYSEQISLTESCHSSPVHWTRRFFGPLGRQTVREFFQPWQAEEWRSLLQGNSRRIEIASGRSASGDSEAKCRFRLSGWPRDVQLRGRSETRQENYAWSCYFLTLVGCVLFRMFRWEIRTRLAAITLSIVGLVCWVAPESVTLFTGAVFAATLTATLIPRVLLLGRRSAAQEEELKLIEGSTLKGMMPHVLILGAIVWTTGSTAAQSTNRSDKSTFPTIDVLIPFSGGSQLPEELPSFVYVRETDRQLPIFQDLFTERPVLFTSAEYRCRLGETETPTIRVRLQAEIPSDRSISQLTIPLAGANLAREGACFVNGEESPVAITSDGLLEISLASVSASGRHNGDGPAPLRAPRPHAVALPASHSVEIELNLYPPVGVQGSLQEWELEIPAISNSRLLCSFPSSGWPAPRFIGSQGEVNLVRPGLISADLGRTSRISCQWTKTSFPEKREIETARLLVEPRAMAVELLPTHLRYRIRTTVLADRGEIDFVRWSVPKHFHLHKVISDGIVLQTQEVLAATHKQIIYDLTETITPETEPQVLEAEFISALRTGSDGEILVEVPDLMAGADGQATEIEVAGSDTIVGLWSPPELPLNVLELPATDIQTPTAEDWKDLWPEDASLPAIERLYQLRAPATLSFIRTSTHPQRVASRVREIGTIGDQYLDWEWHAEVKTTRLPAFQHQFLIGHPKLEILSASVREDQAERVHRWSREGDQLAIRLSRKTEENTQYVTIRGRVPLLPEQELELPEIRLLDVDRIDSRVELYLSPHRTARWLPEDAQTEDGPPPPSSINRSDLTLFDSFTRQADRDTHRRLSIDLKTPPPHFERTTTLRRRSDGEYDVSVMLTERLSSTSQEDPLEVLIPQEWLARLRPLLPMGELVPALEPLPEGGAAVIISPESRAFPLVLQTTLNPPKENSWTVPWPGFDGEATYDNYVSLRLSDGWAPHVDCRIDPVDAANTLNATSTPDRWEYICETLELQRTEISDPKAVPTLYQLLATVDLRPGTKLRGQWWLLYRGRGTSSLTIESPLPLSSIQAQVNDQPVEVEYDSQSHDLTLPLPPGQVWHSCLVNWNSGASFQEEAISELQVPMPAVTDLVARESQAILVTHPDLKLTLHHELKPVSALEFRVTILSAFQKLLKNGEVSPSEVPDGITMLLEALLSANDTGMNQSDDAQVGLLRERLEELRIDLRDLVPFEEESPESPVESSLHSPEVVKWESLLPGLIPGSDRPDRDLIYFSTPPRLEESRLWWMSRRWYRAGIALLIAVVLIPVSLKLIRERTATWAVNHHPLMWLLIGLIWWSCLQLSAVGLLIAVVALIAQSYISLSSQKTART